MPAFREIYDFAVLGAGYGGLSAAALLAKQGYRVALLEAHTVIGGCASYFKRRLEGSFELFTFDVGATTLSGLKANQPIAKLINELGLNDFAESKIKHLDIGMVVKLDGDEICRYANLEAWLKEAKNKFCRADDFQAQANMQNFWQEVYDIDKLSWKLLAENKKLPPTSPKDFIDAIKLSNLKGLKLLPGLFLSLMDLLKKHNLEKNEKFIRFLEEQILITTQNSLEKSPALTSALGLAYPSETYYPYGGIHCLAQEILKKIKSYEGDLFLGFKVNAINFDNKTFEVLCSEKNKSIQAHNIISNIPLWSMAMIDSNLEDYKKYFSKLSENYSDAWGAFVVNFAIPQDFSIKSAYYQIHTKKQIPYCDSKSFFVTMSLDDDTDKAALGWRTVTISLHTKVDLWKGLAEDEYKIQKMKVQNAIMDEFYDAFPEADKSKTKLLSSATPKTFNHFANRYYVGGIPHSIDKNMLLMPKANTPVKDLYMVGDTSFPGQGIPAVIYSAFNVVNSL